MEAIEIPLQQLVAAVRSVLEQTPPELSSDIIDKGMVMSGGGSLLRNIDKLLTQVTGVPCHVAENSLNCVALGTGLALEHFDFFKKSLVRGSTARRRCLMTSGVFADSPPLLCLLIR
jgi:rod shape-determining protein MreB